MEKSELISYKEKLNYNLGQLELDYYQHFALSKIYRKFNSVYFKGGTCLQKCYGIKRFSEDLDFNYVNIEKDEIISLLEKIFDDKMIDFNETRFGFNFSIRFNGILYNGTHQSKCKLSFDFRNEDIVNTPIKMVIRPAYHDLPNYFLLALDKEEIMAEKIRAILTRYKARDVYDLNELILNGVKVDFNLVNWKLKTYNMVFNTEEFVEKLEEKRNIYEEEIKRLTSIYDDFDVCEKRILNNVTMSKTD